MRDPVLRVEGLVTSFPIGRERAAVVDGVALEVAAGEVLALVGESGCGKTLTALSLLRLVPRPGHIDAGSVQLAGREVLRLGVAEMRQLRGREAAMIFQEPMTSLNPVQTVGSQVMEAIRLHQRVSRAEARRRVVELFQRVRIPDPEERFSAYPHQLSGGLKQRIAIAMALALRPRLLIADEPTTALDVTIQAQILELLRELQREFGTAILLISHDLGVVNELADRIAVMYAGRIVEQGPRAELLSHPQHPYTQGLLRSLPALTPPGTRLSEIPGAVPSPRAWPSGCRFHPRCPLAHDRCQRESPGWTRLADSHGAACYALERGAASTLEAR